MNMTSPSPSHWPEHSIFEHDLNYFQKQTKINIDINCNPALPFLPSHNKREQYLGNQITRFRNAPWHWKKNALTSNRSISPWFIYFSSFQPFFPLRFHIYLFISFLLLFCFIIITLVHTICFSLQPYVAVGVSRTKIFAIRTPSPTIDQPCHSLLSCRILRDQSFDSKRLIPKNRR